MWLEPIAEGGMGIVYLAKDKTRNSAQCVIKSLRGDIAERKNDEEIREAKRLFLREVELLKALDHPGIVRFFDSFVSEEGQCFLVMDFITGNNLETIIQNYGPFSQEDVVKIGIQICEVLEYLHEREPPIIYRDLKPSNLMLTPEGQIIFIDFGIARVFMPKTANTRVVTAGYSPPEQYFGRPDSRSDLYALGATMAHLVTGTRPRPLMTSIPSDHGADIVHSFDELIISLTAHSPDDRPDSARIVRHQLYKIYQELNVAFEIPDEVFATESSRREDQFISQKIMSSGLAAARSAQEVLPAARGPEQEFYSDEEMPSAIRKAVDGFSDPRDSGRYSRRDTGSGERTEEYRNSRGIDGEVTAQTRRPRPDKRRSTGSYRRRVEAIEQEEKQTIWQKLFGWVTRR